MGLGIGEGNGNPLQYSCLENPSDRGTWRAKVIGSHRRLHLGTLVFNTVGCVQAFPLVWSHRSKALKWCTSVTAQSQPKSLLSRQQIVHPGEVRADRPEGVASACLGFPFLYFLSPPHWDLICSCICKIGLISVRRVQRKRELIGQSGKKREMY